MIRGKRRYEFFLLLLYVMYGRIGILYRGAKFIRSFRISHGEVVSIEEGVKGVGEILDERWSHVEHNAGVLEEVEEWIDQKSHGNMEEDRSYLEFFYRCLNEDSEYYYLYEQGVGWACGNTTQETPIKSQLVRLSDAMPEMEEFVKSSI